MIRLSPQELEELRGLAMRAGLSVSALVKQWIRVGELPVREPSWRPQPMPTVEDEIAKELAKLKKENGT